MNALKNEPVMAAAVAIAAILTVFGVVVDVNTVLIVLTAVVPLLGGLLARLHVTPVAKVVSTDPVVSAPVAVEDPTTTVVEGPVTDTGEKPKLVPPQNPNV